MRLSDTLLPQLDHERVLTRRLLETLPADKLDFKPHPKSMSLGGLATHIATIPNWGGVMMEVADYDVATAPANRLVESPADAVARLEAGFARLRTGVAAASDDALHAPWTLKNGDATMFTMPRVAALRGLILNHLIHHRGQLTVYLRLLDVALPATYGPSADSQG